MSDIRDLGAVADSSRLSTAAIQRALDQCGAAGGGVVRIPAGSYLSAPLQLRSGVELHLEEGAVLRATEEIDAFPVLSQRWPRDLRAPDVHAPFLRGLDLEEVAITGPGTIDGSGRVWWRAKREKRLRHRRPRLVALTDCRKVRISGITATHSPEWTIHLLSCDEVAIEDVTVRNPATSPNTDGIVPDSSRDVAIVGCRLDVGDDCIAIKAGDEHGERAVGRASCERIRIDRCTMLRGHGAVAIGSETSGWIRDVEIVDCSFDETDRGVRVKTQRLRGGGVEGVRAARLRMTRVPAPIAVNMLYNRKLKREAKELSRLGQWDPDSMPRVRDLRFADIVADEVEYSVVYLHGLPGWPIRDLLFERIRAGIVDHGRKGYPAMIKDVERVRLAGLMGRYVEGAEFRDIVLEGECDPQVSFTDCEQVTIERLAVNRPRRE